MGRCGCGSDQQCLSTNPGNLASYDETGCLYVAEFAPLFGEANLSSAVDLVPLASTAWVDSGLAITIPAAGTYELTADTFIRLHVEISASGSTPTVRVFVRLWNEATSTVLPNTQVTAMSVGSNVQGRYFSAGGSSVHTFVTTTGPTQIKLQVGRADLASGGVTATALDTSTLDSSGTSLRYNRIA